MQIPAIRIPSSSWTRGGPMAMSGHSVFTRYNLVTEEGFAEYQCEEKREAVDVKVASRAESE